MDVGDCTADTPRSVLATDQSLNIVGSLTETAPGTDTASSGLNGRLQRIAQRLTTAIGLLAGGLPAALGAGGGLKVDGSGTALPVSDGGGALTVDGTVAVTNADIASCKTALELLDNSVDGNYLNVNVNVAGTDVAANNGAANAQTMRVTIASDSTGQVKLAAGTANIGDVDVLTVPADPFGVNADAASATGSISAKLRYIAGKIAGAAFGTAGTPSADVVTVQGVASMVPVAVGGNRLAIAATTTIDGAAYAAKDAIGGNLSFANAARAAGGSGVIEAVIMKDLHQQMAAMDLIIASAALTASNNNAFDPSDAEVATILGRIAIAATDYADFNDNSVMYKGNLNIPYVCGGATTTLYGQLVSRGTPDYAADGDIAVTIIVRRD